MGSALPSAFACYALRAPVPWTTNIIITTTCPILLHVPASHAICVGSLDLISYEVILWPELVPEVCFGLLDFMSCMFCPLPGFVLATVCMRSYCSNIWIVTACIYAQNNTTCLTSCIGAQRWNKTLPFTSGFSKPVSLWNLRTCEHLIIHVARGICQAWHPKFLKHPPSQPWGEGAVPPTHWC